MEQQHKVEWRTASPLWDLAMDDPEPDRFFQPVLLRFDSEDYRTVLEKALRFAEPPFATLVARWETNRKPGAGWQTADELAADPQPVKLYQPSHSRFYLAAAALVCKIPGLPDRGLAEGDGVTFVIRRAAAEGEEGWAPAGESGGAWKPVAAGALLEGEERLPLFPVKYAEGKQPRRLLAGYMPLVRLAPAGGPVTLPDDGQQDPKAWFESQMISPLRRLPGVADDGQAAALSAFLLVELGRFLRRYLPRTWAEVESGKATIPLLAAWAGALLEAAANESAILAGAPSAPAFDLRPDATAAAVDQLGQAVAALLADRSEPALAPEQFLVRFIYERKCEEPVVSQPSQLFQVAAFTDPDAPGRVVPTQERKPLTYETQWQIPLPLMDLAAADSKPDRREQPAILRFASDKFVDELTAALAEERPRLEHLVVRHETHGKETVGWQTEAELAKEKEPLKLYQALHGRFYLVTASLTCRLPGLADKEVVADKQESVSLVVRRLIPTGAGAYQEYGWDPNPPQTGWRPVPPGSLLPGEERRPLLAVPYKDGQAERRIWAGYLPVVVRKQPDAAPQPPPAPTRDDQLALLDTRVISELRRIDSIQADDEARQTSTLTLLSLAAWLHMNLPDRWAAIEAADADKTGEPFLVKQTPALTHVWAGRGAILAGESGAPAYDLRGQVPAAEIDALEAFLKADLEQVNPPPPPGEVTAPRLETDPTDLYVVRCVYERPQASAAEAKLLISEASRSFQMADYYDQDAPIQMERIRFPLLKLLMPAKE